MKLKGEFPIDLADELGITNEDLLMYNQSGVIPLTKKAYLALKANKKPRREHLHQYRCNLWRPLSAQRLYRLDTR